MSGYPGSYSDGRSAARIEVAVSLDVTGLRLSDASGGRIALWPYDELVHLGEVFKDGPLRLTCRTEEGARLSLADRALLADLVERAPQLALRNRGWAQRALRWTASLVLAVAVLTGVLWFALPRFAEATAKVVPVAWEVDLGERVLGQILDLFAKTGGERPRFCEAEAGRRVLDRLTGRLAEVARSPYTFKVSVLDIGVTNAFALPGGRIVLFKGLIDFAESPDEVAGVLAHEMGHVTHRHGTEGIVKSLGLAFFFGVMLGDLGSGIVGLAGETLLSTSFSRAAESDADTTARALLEGAGLGARGLAAFFARLEETYGDLPAALALLSTHPSNESRQGFFTGPGGAPAMPEADWQALQAICGEEVEDEE
jgi:Zn-dependent protease with chaperone function